MEQLKFWSYMQSQFNNLNEFFRRSCGVTVRELTDDFYITCDIDSREALDLLWLKYNSLSITNGLNDFLTSYGVFVCLDVDDKFYDTGVNHFARYYL